MKTTLASALLLLGMVSTSAMAHIGYSGRDFGTFDGTTAVGPVASPTAFQSATGNYGWIDGTDSDNGDSHKNVFYRFSLTGTADVTLSFAGATSATVTNALTPGFSVYGGLAHLAPAGADYDTAPGTLLLRDPSTTEGSFKAQSNWVITNNDDPTGTSPTNFIYKGSAYDGSVDYGSGTIAEGDGVADGVVTRTFNLAAGDYTVVVGGLEYSQQTGFGNVGSPTTKYGVTGTLSISPVPEPETYLMMMLGLSAVAGRLRSRRFGSSLKA